MAQKTRRRSVLYQGTEADDAVYTGTPGTKADGTPKTVLDMTMHDDVETLMDHVLFHFSRIPDAEGIEGAIREEFEVIKGDLPAFIAANIKLFQQTGLTPAKVRSALDAGPFRFWYFLLSRRYGRPLLVGLLTGALGTLLFTQWAQESMPPLLWAARYALLALLVIGAISTLRRLHQRYGIPYLLLTISAVAGALVGLMLFKGL